MSCFGRPSVIEYGPIGWKVLSRAHCSRKLSYRRYAKEDIIIADPASDTPGIEPEAQSKESHRQAKHRDNNNESSMVEVVIIHQRR
jgi:hypothetical protein